ncbi:hypothetical protein REPUB_Repub02eG0023900 [Reevesia pubescens]
MTYNHLLGMIRRKISLIQALLCCGQPNIKQTLILIKVAVKHKISMSSLSERSVMHIFGVRMMVIMTLMMIIIATESSPILSPLSSAASDVLFNDPMENKKQQQQLGGEEIKESYQQQDHQKANFEDDYGVWNPTPRSGGAYASPVPHAEDRQYSTTFSSKIISG